MRRPPFHAPTGHPTATRRRPRPHRLAAGLAAALATALLAPHTRATEPEVRGTWLTTTANDAIANPQNTADTMRRLAEIGLNTVYVETWKNGYTQFPSEVLKRTLGVDRKPALAPFDPSDPPDRAAKPGRDLLQETLIEAHRNRLIYIAWFEYGFMAAYKDTDNHLRRMKPHWLTRTQDGELVSDQNPFVWMNPLHPEARRFLLDLVLEAVDKYDLDGVQLDDRIAWPVTMGYDDYTKAVYAMEHAGAMPPEDPRDPQWVRWRADKVTEFAQQFHTELKAKRPHLIVSISPAVYPWSLDNYACDWPAWAKQGWMDEYVPQVYRFSYERFAQDWPIQLEAIGDERRHDLLAGMRIVGEGPDIPWPELVDKITLTREASGGGHVHWFSRGVLEVYPDRLQGFYDVASKGPAPHPKRPRSWRPAPRVAQETDDPGVWAVEVDQPGNYRVIVKRNGVWDRIDSRPFDAGRATLDAPDAQAVELLVDRR